MVEHYDEGVLVVFRRMDDVLDADVRIARRLERNALVVAEARELVELVAFHRADHDAARERLGADPGDLVVFVWERGREHYLGRGAASGGEGFLNGVSPVDPLAAGHQLARALVVPCILVVSQIASRRYRLSSTSFSYFSTCLNHASSATTPLRLQNSAQTSSTG